MYVTTEALLQKIVDRQIVKQMQINFQAEYNWLSDVYFNLTRRKNYCKTVHAPQKIRRSRVVF